jgi:hypothetical protein
MPALLGPLSQSGLTSIQRPASVEVIDSDLCPLHLIQTQDSTGWSTPCSLADNIRPTETGETKTSFVNFAFFPSLSLDAFERVGGVNRSNSRPPDD